MRLPTVVLAVAGLATVALGAATVMAWSADGDGAPAASTQTVVATGRDLFLAKGCAVCHDGPDTESQFDAAPDLGELPRVAATRQAGLGAADYVRRSITSPDSFTVPGFGSEGMGSMPALALTAGEVEALTQYLLAS